MKTTLITSALIALTVAASGSAFAQHDDRGDRRNDHMQQQNNDHNDGPRGNGDNHGNDNRGNDHRGNDSARNDDGRKYHRDDMRGGGPRHDLRRGQRLNQEYRDNRYVVNDWRARRLSAPPRGHQWVRTGNDYVLAAIATGIIAQVLIGN